VILKEEKMDLTIDVADYKLNIRAAGIIIHNNKVLVHRNINSDHYGLLGGRISIGESSEQTVKREIFEEIGKEVDIIEYMATIENFFEMKGSKYYEIQFVYRVEFKNELDKKIEHTLYNVEGKDNMQYEWLDLDKIEEYPLLPIVAKECLIKNVFPVHKIQYDDMKKI
jgi:ADP-ribose pyrophosphatase YjhB (NUDIX family)